MKNAVKQSTDQYVNDNRQFINGNVAAHLIETANAFDNGWLEYLTEKEIEEYENSSERAAELVAAVKAWINDNYNFETFSTEMLIRNNKEEIIRQTIELLPNAFRNQGNFIASVAFFVEEEVNGVKVDFYPYTGNQSHGEKVFCKIEGHKIPSITDLGYSEGDSFEDVDFNAVGYNDRLSDIIDEYLETL